MSGLDAAVTAVVRAARPYATAVTVVLADGARAQVRCFGRVGRDRSAPPCTPDTVFELGSVSKTFTALLLADLAARGELALDDLLEERLPRHWRTARVRSAEPIRLLHLATHTSGLPRLPPGLLATAAPTWFSNPYETFHDERLRDGLARTTVRGTPGSRFRYSNYGAGLLGRALAETGGLPYGELLTERICGPLGLRDTTCSPNQPGRATGHRRGQPLPAWSIPGLPGAGGVRSSGADLLRYLRAHLDRGRHLGRERAELAVALREVQRPRLRLRHSGDELCLIWNRRRSGERDLCFHSGGTRGFTAFVGFSPDGSAGVAVLANTAPALDGRFVQAGYELLRSAAGVTRSGQPDAGRGA
ncbi:serine hydrolase domain-containing protein [Kitasatospora sp. NPDC056783]|uniref:serine hydrolase domain-containing protein n=1 Tax=Kitasatospora sp. NPDC056783 TaxID=3345943 RepID=UPI003681B741